MGAAALPLPAPDPVMRRHLLLPLLAAALVPVACSGEDREPASMPDGGGQPPSPRIVDEGMLAGSGALPLFYRVLGDADDTVVVLHGGPGAGMESVLPSVAPLARDHTVILYDQRGGGRSGLPEDTAALSSRRFVEDLDAVRAHFGLETMALVAHSFGAVLAAEYARTRPDRVERLVLHGATGPNRAEAARSARGAGDPGPAPDTALTRRSRELLATLLSGEAEDPVATCRAYEEVVRTMARDRGDEPSWRGSTCRAPPDAVRYYYRYTARVGARSFGEWDYTEGSLDEVEAPALVLAGADQSAAALLQQEAWAEAYPEGRLLVVPGSGKGAFDEAPEIVFPALTTFFDGSWPPGAR